MEQKETINDRINLILKKGGYNVGSFANFLELPWTTIKNITSGRNAPSYDVIVKILNKIDWIDANYLIMGQPVSEKNVDINQLASIIDKQRERIDELTNVILNMNGEKSAVIS